MKNTLMQGAVGAVHEGPDSEEKVICQRYSPSAEGPSRFAVTVPTVGHVSASSRASSLLV